MAKRSRSIKIAAGLEAGVSLFGALSSIAESQTNAFRQELTAESELFNANIVDEQIRIGRAQSKITTRRKRKAQEALLGVIGFNSQYYIIGRRTIDEHK